MCIYLHTYTYIYVSHDTLSQKLDVVSKRIASNLLKRIIYSFPTLWCSTIQSLFRNDGYESDDYLPNVMHLPLFIATSRTCLFCIYHTVTQVTVDDVPGGSWNDLFGLQGKPLFSSVYSSIALELLIG